MFSCIDLKKKREKQQQHEFKGFAVEFETFS